MRRLNAYRVTERFALHVGYACNARCSFCYYLPEIEAGTARRFSTATLLRRIDVAARFGKRAVDVTGGEPTIRPDLPRILSRCRDRGLHAVTLITNGMRTSDRPYAEALVSSGLTEGLFSLHGGTAEAHDGLTKRPGSFESLLLSMRNFRDLGMGVRVNTVVTAGNATELSEVFARVEPFRPAEVNVLVFNPAESAARLDTADAARTGDLRPVAEAISSALDSWKARFEAVNVRFLPFCLLPRHADAVRTQWQKAHEDHEWDPFLNVWFQKGLPAAVFSAVGGAFLLGRGPRYRAADPPTLLSKCLSAFRMSLLYRHGRACRSCALRRICPGLARDHVARFGFPEVQPMAGAPVTDPLHFVRGQMSRFASLRER